MTTSTDRNDTAKTGGSNVDVASDLEQQDEGGRIKEAPTSHQSKK